MRLITPPLPAESRPSNSTTTFSFLWAIQILKLNEFALQTQQLLEVKMTLGRVEFGMRGGVVHQRCEVIVVDLQLELLVETVHDLAVNPFRQRAAVGLVFRTHVRVPYALEGRASPSLRNP